MLGIISVLLSIMSLIISSTVLSHVREQKVDYNKARKNLYSELSSLQQNIWDDDLLSNRIRDKLQTNLYKYAIRYWKISSPICLFHVHRCIHNLKKDDIHNYKKTICNDLNYIIARLTKKE